MPQVMNAALPTLTALSLLIVGITPARSEVLWYGGDINPRSSSFNNTRLTDAYGSTVLDDFVVTDAASWHVTGLFSNNTPGYSTGMPPFTEAAWSVRTGVANGEFGTFLFSGISPVTVTPTGRTGGEFTVAVNNLSFDLAPGSYFMSVSPIAQGQYYYVGRSGGANAVGTAGSRGIFRESRFIVNGAPDNRILEYISPLVQWERQEMH
ncbi:hypothetical protein NDA01_31125 [Trichocoleus desertorum AS-A10]|uniref:hypothetical protein n=1 Tax=Trichocoleus desertorum TaxID=1481672 RepID=UPI0032971433